jgi:hypothetical protein
MMEKILPVYIMLVAAITFVLVLTALRGDESLTRKWARERVRVDENRGKGMHDRSRISEPQEEEFNMGRALALMFFGMMMLILMLLNGV